MASELRAALEAARENIGKKVPEGDPWYLLDEHLDKIECRVRSWLREKAGEELVGTVGAALDDWGASKPDSTINGIRYANLDGLLTERLSPLFAALRERAEEAEARDAKKAEIARKAAGDIEDGKGDSGLQIWLADKALREIGGSGGEG